MVTKHFALTDAEREAVTGAARRHEIALSPSNEQAGDEQKEMNTYLQSFLWLFLGGAIFGLIGTGSPGATVVFGVVFGIVFGLIPAGFRSLDFQWLLPPPALPASTLPQSLSETLVQEGWTLPADETRIPSPVRLATEQQLLLLAHRDTPWGRQLFVEIAPKWDRANNLLPELDYRFPDQARPSAFGAFRGILALIDEARYAGQNTRKFVHAKPEPRGKDSSDDVDFESAEFNAKYRVDCSSARYAYQVMAPSTLALLIDTFDHPDDLLDQPLPARPARFEYHVEPGSVLVFRHHDDSDDFEYPTSTPFWTPRDEFIFLEAQFDRFFATLPGGLTGGR
jgi:hypothetical protein